MNMLLRSTLILAATLLVLAAVGDLKVRAAAPATTEIGHAGDNPPGSIVAASKRPTMKVY